MNRPLTKAYIQRANKLLKNLHHQPLKKFRLKPQRKITTHVVDWRTENIVTKPDAVKAAEKLGKLYIEGGIMTVVLAIQTYACDRNSSKLNMHKCTHTHTHIQVHINTCKTRKSKQNQCNLLILLSQLGYNTIMCKMLLPLEEKCTRDLCISYNFM